MEFRQLIRRRPAYTIPVHLLVTSCLLVVFGLIMAAGAVNVSAVTNYDLWVGGTRVTSDNATKTGKTGRMTIRPKR